VRYEASWVIWGVAGGQLTPCQKQGRQSSDLARESKLEIGLVKERSSAVVIIASELSLREKLDYFVGSTFSSTPYFFNLPGMMLIDTRQLTL